MPRTDTIALFGSGPSALTAALLLTRSGWDVRVTNPKPRCSRAITVSESTWSLLCEIWQTDLAQLTSCRPIPTRFVDWSDDENVGLLPVASYAVELDQLTDAMNDLLLRSTRGMCQFEHMMLDRECFETFDWIMDGQGRIASDAIGRRHTAICNLGINCHPNDGSEVYGGRGFWAFVSPVRDNAVTLQVTVAAGIQSTEKIRQALKKLDTPDSSVLSRLLAANAIDDVQPTWIESSPTMVKRTSKQRHLPIGSALMAFDPICGDGLGQAIKSSVLAAATVNAVRAGLDMDVAVGHFWVRSELSFVAHLKNCCRFYHSCREPHHWAHELTTMCDWLSKHPASSSPLRLVMAPGPLQVR